MSHAPAVFVKGIVGPDESLDDGKPQIAFIGRSNVGKSSVINSLTRTKGLARTSSLPGRTREIILFNKQICVLCRLARVRLRNGFKGRARKIQLLIYWYLFDSPYTQKKVVLIIDAVVGLTENDKKCFSASGNTTRRLLLLQIKSTS